jgi:hypothetical protein
MKRIPLSLFLFFLIYTSYSQTIPLEGLIASYSFSGNATDATNSRLNGIVNGAVLAPNRFNIANEAYYFNGTANIDITSNILRNPEYTYAAWVKPTALPGNNELFTMFSVGANGGDQLIAINNSYFGDTQNIPKFDMPNFIGQYQSGPYLLSNEIISADRWYFATFVRTLDSLSIYIDGIKSSSIYSTGVSPYYAGNTAKIGSRFNGLQGFRGVIDDFYIYNRALSPNEILSLKKFGEPLSHTIDLTLKSQQTSRKVEIGSEIETKIVLRNQSQVTATNIKVHVNTPNATPFVRFVGSTPTRGEFNINSGLWQIPSLVSQDSVVLTLRYNPSEYGIWFVESEVFSSDQPDSDSTPSNQTQAEDDYARSCISVPVKVSSSTFAGRQIIIQDPTLTNITWRKDGVIIPNQTSNILQVTSVGSYTFESPNFICPTQGCCPYIFEVGPQTLCCEPLEYIYGN